MKGIDFWVNFVAGNSNKLQKLGLEGKFSWTLDVFTLGPTAQATLVWMTITNSTVNSNKYGYGPTTMVMFELLMWLLLTNLCVIKVCFEALHNLEESFSIMHE